MSFEEVVDGAVGVPFDLAVVTDVVDVDLIVEIDAEVGDGEGFQLSLVVAVLMADVRAGRERCPVVEAQCLGPAHATAADDRGTFHGMAGDVVGDGCVVGREVEPAQHGLLELGPCRRLRSWRAVGPWPSVAFRAW